MTDRRPVLESTLYSAIVGQLPIDLPDDLATRLARAVDIEGKIGRGLDALGPIADRDVLVVDRDTGRLIDEMVALGARLRHSPGSMPLHLDAPDGSADVVVGLWSSFRGVDPAEASEVNRVLRPGGRLLVVHDYGRDDVSRLRGDQPEYGTWGRRNGPFLSGGFRVRVLHCWWTFDSLEAAGEVLAAAFGDAGAVVAADLKRPRLSYNVAIYHRDRDPA